MLSKLNKISIKIMGIFVLSAIVSIVIGVMSYRVLTNIRTDSEYVLSEIKPISLNIMLVDRSFNKLKDYANLILNSRGEDVAENVASYKRLKMTLKAAVSDLRAAAKKAGLVDLEAIARNLSNMINSYDNEVKKAERFNRNFYDLKGQIEKYHKLLLTNIKKYFSSSQFTFEQIDAIYQQLFNLNKVISELILGNKKVDSKKIIDIVLSLKDKLISFGSVSGDVYLNKLKELIPKYKDLFINFDRNNTIRISVQNKMKDIEEKIQGGLTKKGLIKEASLAYEVQLNKKLSNVIKLATSSGYYIGIILFIGILIVLVVGFLISFNIVKAINEMEKKAVEISNGNFDEKIEIYSKDELGTLAKAFNKMVLSIKSMMEKESTTKEYLQRQVELISKIIKKASEGDLTARITQKLDGDIGILADDFNKMVDNLNNLILTVARLVKEVVSSVDNINSFAQEQAEGAKIQSIKISDTSVAMEELTVSIQQVSDNAQIAEKEAMRATEVAVQGGLAVQKTIDGMKNIRITVQETAKKIKGLGESSQEIGEIVEVISDIAEQTNLLALNAAIEAARAGEHGRGFAVVADEIRVLADKSGKAAKEIEMLIKRIQAETNESVMAMEQGTKGVLEGTKLADEAGIALKKIVEVVTKTSEVIKEISLAAKQQATASEEVVGSMENISEITNKVTKGAEAIFEATRRLGDLSQELQESIVAFKVKDE